MDKEIIIVDSRDFEEKKKRIAEGGYEKFHVKIGRAHV